MKKLKKKVNFSEVGLMIMSVTPDVLFLNVFMIPGFILLAALFYYQTQRKNRQAIYLSIGLFFAILGQMIYVTGMILNLDQIGLEMAKRGRDFIFGIFYYFIYRHFESLRHETPNRVISNIFAAIMGIFTLLTGAFLLYPENDIIHELLRRFANVIGLATFGYALFISVETTSKVKEKESMAESISLAFLFIAHIIYVLGDNFFLMFLNPLSGYEDIADILSTCGLFGYVITYITNIDYLYRLPIPIHQIIIYNQAGLPVYARKVSTEGVESPYVDEALFTGVLSAISSLMRDSLGSGVKILQIDSTKQHVFLRHHSKLSLAVIADSGTKFLLNSLKTLYNQITDDFRQDLNKPTVDIGQYQNKLDILTKQAFPYIRFR